MRRVQVTGAVGAAQHIELVVRCLADLLAVVEPPLVGRRGLVDGADVLVQVVGHQLAVDLLALLDQRRVPLGHERVLLAVELHPPRAQFHVAVVHVRIALEHDAVLGDHELDAPALVGHQFLSCRGGIALCHRRPVLALGAAQHVRVVQLLVLEVHEDGVARGLVGLGRLPLLGRCRVCVARESDGHEAVDA